MEKDLSNNIILLLEKINRNLERLVSQGSQDKRRPISEPLYDGRNSIRDKIAEIKMNTMKRIESDATRYDIEFNKTIGVDNGN